MNTTVHTKKRPKARALTLFGKAIAASLLVGFTPATVLAVNFTRGTATATKYGVHEISLTGNGSVTIPFDTVATVKFTPPSGSTNAKTVNAFYVGGNNWRARVYVPESGT